MQYTNGRDQVDVDKPVPRFLNFDVFGSDEFWYAAQYMTEESPEKTPFGSEFTRSLSYKWIWCFILHIYLFLSTLGFPYSLRDLDTRSLSTSLKGVRIHLDCHF